MSADHASPDRPEHPAAANRPERTLPDFVEGIDAEALWFFLTLQQAGSLPRAAEQMGVSLSSANRMLAKLRTYWGTPLFERSGFTMRPTPDAKRKAVKVRTILRLLEELRHEGEVDPATLTRTLRIACYDNAFACALAANFAAFSKRLPNVTLQVTQADENLFENLVNDRLDAVFFARQSMETGIHSVPVLTTPYVCVVGRPDHPLAGLVAKRREKGQKPGLTKQDLAPYRQVLINAQPDRYRRPNSPAGGWFNPEDAHGVAIVTPFFLSIPLCLAGTDCYAVVPELTARIAFAGQPVTLLPVTDAAPKLTIRLGWHERTQNDVASQFIRAVLVDLIGKKTAEVLGVLRQ